MYRIISLLLVILVFAASCKKESGLSQAKQDALKKLAEKYGMEVTIKEKHSRTFKGQDVTNLDEIEAFLQAQKRTIPRSEALDTSWHNPLNDPYERYPGTGTRKTPFDVKIHPKSISNRYNNAKTAATGFWKTDAVTKSEFFLAITATVTKTLVFVYCTSTNNFASGGHSLLYSTAWNPLAHVEQNNTVTRANASTLSIFEHVRYGLGVKYEDNDVIFWDSWQSKSWTFSSSEINNVPTGGSCDDKDDDPKNGHAITLEKNSGVHLIYCPPDVNILDEALEEGIDLPYSCRAGSCSSCVGKIIFGIADQWDQNYLDDDQIEAGYVLLCVAKPMSTMTIETDVEEEILD